jgi:hypothetical protein
MARSVCSSMPVVPRHSGRLLSVLRAMDDAAEIQLRRQCRISLRNIRRTALLLGIPAVGILVLQHFVSVSLWAPLVVVAVLSLTIIGDLVTYIRSRRKLRRDENHGPT